jgi:hypothetical protein
VVAVSKGRIPNGTDILFSYSPLRTAVPGKVAGYIPDTDAYLVAVSAGSWPSILAVPAEKVMRKVPQFNSTEEADAWLEAQ